MTSRETSRLRSDQWRNAYYDGTKRLGLAAARLDETGFIFCWVKKRAAVSTVAL
jgi:hypothetical protein